VTTKQDAPSSVEAIEGYPGTERQLSVVSRVSLPGVQRSPLSCIVCTRHGSGALILGFTMQRWHCKTKLVQGTLITRCFRAGW